MTVQEAGVDYYDLQIRKDELAQKLEEIKSRSQSRKQENQKLSLFYQHDLEQWMERVEREKARWQQKRGDLSSRCIAMQDSLKNRWSSTEKRLHREKEKYCNVIIRLLPEWQKVIERKQMREISQFESKASLIQQRRRSADIAFEKEKKLLSLLSIRKQEIDKLQSEEKEDAFIRNEERKSISTQHNDLEDTLRSTRYHSFADARIQEYVIRKEVTSEMERKLSAQIDGIKSQLIRKRRASSMDDTHGGKDSDPLTATKSTANSTESPEYALDDQPEHRQRAHHRSVSFAEEDGAEHDDEEKEETLHRTESLRSANGGEGDQTLPIADDFNSKIEDAPKAVTAQNLRESALSLLRKQSLERQQKEEEEAAKHQLAASSNEATSSREVDSLETGELAAERITNASALSLPVLSSDSEIDGNGGGEDVAPNDTSQIERAVGLIEVDAGKREEAQSRKPAPITISITSENDEEKKYQSPKQKPQQQSQLKLKRSFRARTSKNRWIHRMLASPTQNSEDAVGSVTHNVPFSTKTVAESANKSLSPTLSTKKIHSLNDFDDEQPLTPQPQTANNESSDDEFDF